MEEPDTITLSHYKASGDQELANALRVTAIGTGLTAGFFCAVLANLNKKCFCRNRLQDPNTQDDLKRMYTIESEVIPFDVIRAALLGGSGTITLLELILCYQKRNKIRETITVLPDEKKGTISVIGLGLKGVVCYLLSILLTADVPSHQFYDDPIGYSVHYHDHGASLGCVWDPLGALFGDF